MIPHRFLTGAARIRLLTHALSSYRRAVAAAFGHRGHRRAWHALHTVRTSACTAHPTHRQDIGVHGTPYPVHHLVPEQSPFCPNTVAFILPHAGLINKAKNDHAQLRIREPPI